MCQLGSLMGWAAEGHPPSSPLPSFIGLFCEQRINIFWFNHWNLGEVFIAVIYQNYYSDWLKLLEKSLFLERGEEMEKDRKRNMDRCPLEESVPLHAPNGGPGLQHSMCPDWELGIRSRSSHLSICRDNAQPTETHQSGLTGTFMNKFPTNEATLIH